MFCFQARSKLPALLAGQLAAKPKEKIEQHLKNCRYCQEELVSLQKLDKILLGYPAVEVSTDFTANFWAKAHAEERVTVRAGACFYRWATAILLLGLLSGIMGGVYSAQFKARRHFMTSVNLNHLRDYPPDSLGGKTIVLAGLK
jgi:anti-sigma factor RsiW